MKRTKSKRTIALGSFALIAIGIFGWLQWDRNRREEPGFAARTFHQCLSSGDVDCLVRLQNPDEAAIGPSADQLRRFYKEIYLPRMRRFRPTGDIKLESGLDPEISVYATQGYADDAGNRIYVDAHGYYTGGSATVWPVFTSLLLPLFQTYKKPSVQEPGLVVWNRALRDLQPELERIGIRNLFLLTGPSGREVTIEDWIRENDQKLKKM